ncbi:hypothetical protein BLNAU_8425 [Blattamonas nauphoetae]|uniref:Uncharacterized protein n=1 Tax=Blattamonas nauphoetae TaxID=2049346 RepID=A0ABQ9XYK8_9EUKA|nr:hypothetical protein BLNAU_8425 [Blattamonas nauphoetae]
MADLDTDTCIALSSGCSDLLPLQLPISIDSSDFLNWNGRGFNYKHEDAIIIRSLVVTVKLNPALDVSLAAKAKKLLESVNPRDASSADDFLHSLGRTDDESLTNFIESILELVSSSSQIIINSAMKMLITLFRKCSAHIHLTLVKADLIPQLIISLNPLSLSFAEKADIHINLMKIIIRSLRLTTPDGLTRLAIKYENGQQAVHETVLTQVLVPSKKYIRRLCVIRFSIIGGGLSALFLSLLAYILQICPYYQRTLDSVLYLPIFLTIQSYLSFIEKERSIWHFLVHMIATEREWNRTRGEVRQRWPTVQRMLRMEGFEDVIEEKLRNDRGGLREGKIVAKSIRWSNFQGMNLPKEE